MKELIRTWRKNGFILRLYDLNRLDSMGKWTLGYEFKDGRVVIFEGEDFHLSPLLSVDSLDAAYQLLFFLSLRPGDTDTEYFEKYTAEQLAWSQSPRCDELAFIVSEWEEKHNRQ